ncbi:MAG: hypothetical protein AB1444_15920 [Spirochaetota bacterium]
MIKRYVVLCICFLFPLYSVAQDCVPISFNALRMLAESRIDPCPICQKKLQKQALGQITKDIYLDRKIVFNSSCSLMKTQQTKDNELMLMTNYDSKIMINGAETDLPYIILKFYTHENHIVGIDEKDYTSREIQNMYKNLMYNKPVEAEVTIIPYKYSDFASAMYLPERNALIIHCKIIRLQQIQ